MKENIVASTQVFKGQDEKSEDDENKDEKKITTKVPLACLSIAWSKNGTYLYSGWSDNRIRVYEISSKTN